MRTEVEAMTVAIVEEAVMEDLEAVLLEGGMEEAATAVADLVI